MTSSEIYKKYQENIKKSEQIQTEILKGLKEAKDIYVLFLKACKIISLINSDNVFYEEASKDIRYIYGAGLCEKSAVELEIYQTQKRLDKLKKSIKEENETDAKDRINKAIRYHEEKIKRYQNKINIDILNDD